MVYRPFQLLQRAYSQKSKSFDKKLLNIPLRECGEELLYLPNLSEKYGVNIIFNNKETASALLRKSAAILLMQAARCFNQHGFSLKVESAYRSLDNQKNKFIKRYQSMKGSFPGKSKSELLKLANTYTAGIPILAAHTAGAAVDTTLLDKNGNFLDFGAPYMHGDIESVTDYPNFPKKVKENRKILKEGMEKFGFINYPFEYWHYSIGDVCAAYLTSQKYAKFGPVNYDFKKKTILPNRSVELYKFFDILVKS